jgi:hypothetical protein
MSNIWSDVSFKDMLTLLKNMLSQGNAIPDTVYEEKYIIYSLGLEVEKYMRARLIAFYIMGLSMKTLRNALFVYSTDSIVEKIAMMTRITTEEKADLKSILVLFYHSSFESLVYKQKGVRIVVMAQREA